MDTRGEISDFLTTRRARLLPEQVGLAPGTGRRRVSGLRREEVAQLAGISPEYYVRLERGNVGQVSPSVLEGLARALRLGEVEREHLYDLVTAAEGSRYEPSWEQEDDVVRPSVRRILEGISWPAYVRNRRFDVLATNAPARVLCSPFLNSSVTGHRPNTAAFAFLDPAARDYFVDFEDSADNVVAYLRSETGRFPQDRDLAAFIEQLSDRSPDFRRRWAAHEVRQHRTGTKRLNHPELGRLDLDFDVLLLADDPSMRINLYSAAPGTDAARALEGLGSRAEPGAGARP